VSDFDDYPDDMMRFATFSDGDVERVLDGTADAPELADLASFLEGLRREAAVQVDEDAVLRYVSGAAAVTAAEPGRVGAGASVAVAVSNSEGKSGMATSVRLRRALAATVSAVVLFGSVSGVALAADGADPGDGLYGIDRALERVGIGNGGVEERLEEARTLAGRGDVALGLRHAAAAFEDEAADDPSGGEVEGEGSGGDDIGDGAPGGGEPAGDGATSNAGEALLAAAETVRSAGAERSQEVRDGVAALLTYLSENVGTVDGAMVAVLAQDIGRHGPPGDRPVSPPVVEPPATPTDEPIGEPPVVAVDEPLEEPSGQPEDRPVGPPEGRPVAPPVVEPPGQPEDRPVGPPEGRPVAPPVVEPPGQSEGRPVGPPEGRPVGPPEGRPVGPPEGRPVGPPEGRPVEPSAGGPGAPGRP
jgi:hypothetical protein